MGTLGKMEALKQAATELVDTVSTGLPAGTEVAFSVVPFATQVRIPTALSGAPWLEFKSGDPNPVFNTAKATWDGCIMDRDKPHNTDKVKPATGKKEEAYPAQNCTFPNLRPSRP